MAARVKKRTELKVGSEEHKIRRVLENHFGALSKKKRGPEYKKHLEELQHSIKTGEHTSASLLALEIEHRRLGIIEARGPLILKKMEEYEEEDARLNLDKPWRFPEENKFQELFSARREHFRKEIENASEMKSLIKKVLKEHSRI
ncbi:hypothetical protein K8R43_05825 [archaeon]|nr:hypothetical protein [archaeon]